MTAEKGPVFDVEPVGLEGFNKFYDAKIEPILAKGRGRRRLVLGADGRKAWTLIACISAVSLVLVAMSGWDFRALAFIPMFGVPIWLVSRLGGLDEARKIELSATGAILDWVGLKEISPKERPPKHAVDPSHDRPFEQQMDEPRFYECQWVEGTFHFSVGWLDKSPGGRGASVSGQVLVFEIPSGKRFLKPVGFRRVAGGFEILTDIVTGAANRVELEDTEFMKEFEVWCDDQIAARYALTPSMMERIRTFNQGGTIFAGRFVGQSLFIAVRPYELFLLEGIWDRNDVSGSVRLVASMGARPKNLYAALAAWT